MSCLRQGDDLSVRSDGPAGSGKAPQICSGCQCFTRNKSWSLGPFIWGWSCQIVASILVIAPPLVCPKSKSLGLHLNHLRTTTASQLMNSAIPVRVYR